MNRKITLQSAIRNPQSEGPGHINIEVTNDCNLRCVMCPGRKMPRPVGYMKMALYQKICDEALRIGTRSFLLYLSGEPLLHPELPEIVRYAKEAGISFVGLSTNATLLTESKARQLLESGIDRITISLDGVNKETYESLRIGARFNQVIKNVQGLLKVRKKLTSGTHLELQIIKMKETVGEIPDFIKKWQARLDVTHGDTIRIQYFDTWAGQVKDRSVYLPIVINGQTIDKLPYIKYVDTLGFETEKKRPCGRLRHALDIYWNGDVVLCCRDLLGKSVFGNVDKEGIMGVWEGSRRQEILEADLAGDYSKIPLCANCRERHFYPYP